MGKVMVKVFYLVTPDPAEGLVPDSNVLEMEVDGLPWMRLGCPSVQVQGVSFQGGGNGSSEGILKVKERMSRTSLGNVPPPAQGNALMVPPMGSYYSPATAHLQKGVEGTESHIKSTLYILQVCL